MQREEMENTRARQGASRREVAGRGMFIRLGKWLIREKRELAELEETVDRSDAVASTKFLIRKTKYDDLHREFMKRGESVG